MLDIRDPISRASLDTYYQVDFDFGKTANWLTEDDGLASGGKIFDGGQLKTKMSVLCNQAEIPGTSYLTTQAVGHYQGIQEQFPTLRQFPPLNLSFYIDANHVILRVWESWMTYINPVYSNKRTTDNAYGRLNYPDDYKETIHITKFERDAFIDEKRYDYKNAQKKKPTSRLTQYEFRNVWPTNMESMRISYGGSEVLRCTVQLAYDRFFTEFDKSNIVENAEDRGVISNVPLYSKEISSTTPPAGSFNFSKKNIRDTGQLVRADNAQYGDTFPAGSF
tara:strand:+ start:241 stop:1074 length:834 start_codon:yes stop_codon:yes gene_type:complete